MDSVKMDSVSANICPKSKIFLIRGQQCLLKTYVSTECLGNKFYSYEIAYNDVKLHTNVIWEVNSQW